MNGVGAPFGCRGRHESWEVPVQIERSTRPGAQSAMQGPASRLGYTPAEVAAIVGKHQNTIYLWLKAGVLKSRRINRDHYIPVAEVIALLDEGAVA